MTVMITPASARVRICPRKMKPGRVTCSGGRKGSSAAQDMLVTFGLDGRLGADSLGRDNEDRGFSTKAKVIGGVLKRTDQMVVMGRTRRSPMVRSSHRLNFDVGTVAVVEAFKTVSTIVAFGGKARGEEYILLE
jgi:hypothetical protein